MLLLNRQLKTINITNDINFLLLLCNFPRETWIVKHDAEANAVKIDALSECTQITLFYINADVITSDLVYFMQICFYYTMSKIINNNGIKIIQKYNTQLMFIQTLRCPKIKILIVKFNTNFRNQPMQQIIFCN